MNNDLNTFFTLHVSLTIAYGTGNLGGAVANLYDQPVRPA